MSWMTWVAVVLVGCGSENHVPGDAPDAPALDDASTDSTAQSPAASCDGWYARGSRGSGGYLIDPDGSGGDAAFAVYCDLAGTDGGWTLAATLSVDAAGPWNLLSTWSASATFGVADSTLFTADMKNLAYSRLPFTRMRLVSSGGGRIVTDAKAQTSLAALFSSPTRVSFSGTATGWTYASVNNTNFIAEVQNPPVTDGVNRAERNECILTTGYDTYPDPGQANEATDDQVQGFGCVAGTVGCNPTFGTCGEVSREASVQIYIR